MTPRAVIFDLYETLVTEVRPDRVGGRPEPAALGLDPAAFRAGWSRWKQHRLTNVEPGYQAILRDICARAGVPVDDAVLGDLHAARIASKEACFEVISPDVRRMLEALSAAGTKLGLITNCTPDEITAWDRSVFAELIPVALFSCHEGCAKPDAAIYLRACERLGVAPDKALFVGDGAHDELAGAARAGLEARQATWFLSKWPRWDGASLGVPVLAAPSELYEGVDSNR